MQHILVNNIVKVTT